MKRRLLAILLSLTLMLSLVPTAWAAESGDQPNLQSDEVQPTEGNEESVPDTSSQSMEKVSTPVLQAVPEDGIIIRENTTWDTARTLNENLTVTNGATLTIGAQVTVSGDVTISGGTIKRASDYTGSLLVVTDGSSLTLANITIDGGAIWTGGVDETLERGTVNSGLGADSALVTVNGGTLTLNRGTVIQNNERTVGTDDDAWIEWTRPVAKTVRYYAVGGGVSVVGGSLIVNDGAVVKNNTIKDSDKVNDATSDAMGGGIGLYDCASLVVNGGEISGNQAQTSGTARAMGGGIGMAAHPGSRYVSCEVCFKGGELKNNLSVTSGGGAYFTSDCEDETGINALDVSFSGGTISENKAGAGGGIIVWGGKAALSGEVAFTNNQAPDGNGGGAYFSTRTIVSIDGGTYSRNTSKYGGGIAWNGVKFEFRNGTVSNNSVATTGGGLRLSGNTAETSAVISGGIISENTATGGAGVWADYVTISGGTISQNRADGNNQSGGGVFVNHIFKLSGTGTITENSAYTGGGICIGSQKDSTFEITGGTISKNKATGSTGGGGIYCAQAVAAYMTDGLITENVAETGSGGGLYLRGKFELKGGTISKNRAPLLAGGGVNVYSNAEMVITDGTISGNEANEAAGIRVVGTLTMNGGTVEKNCAKPIYDVTTQKGKENNNGGGVSVGAGAAFIMNGGLISKNTAKYGAGISTWRANQFEIHGGEISENSTENMTYSKGDSQEETVNGTYGAGINLGGNTTLLITGGKIINNTANQYGGGINVPVGNRVQISGTPVITGNTANNEANNVYLRHDSKTNGNSVIDLTGKLESGSVIGVKTEQTPTATTNTSIQITSGEDGTAYYNGAARYFIPDATKVIAQANESGQYVELAHTDEIYHKVTLNLTHATATGALTTQVKANDHYSAAVTADTGYTLPDAKPDGLTGYDLINNRTTAYIAINSVSQDATITLEAVPNTYTVVFDANGGSGIMDTKQNMTYDTSAPLTANAFTKAGYNFAGWSESKGGEVKYPDGTSVKNLTAENDKTITLYAVWTKKQVIPAFSSSAIQSYKYDGSVKAYTLTSDIKDFDITYKQGETVVTTPKDIGTYDVIISRAEDDTYAAFSQTITGGLVITKVSSGSSSSNPTYSVTTPSKSENGGVAVSSKNARKGDTVTVTVTPDAGYQLDKLTVTDKDGKELKLTDKGDGKYSFTMPDGKVEIKAVFAKKVETSPFDDVSADAYYNQAVQWAQEKGITDGISSNLFGPKQPCTRSQIVTFLWRAAGSPEPKGTTAGMTDVVPGSYYAKAVAWAVENGITTGTAEGTFSPDATCTRAQAVTFLARAQNAKATGKTAFSDVPADSYFADAVAWAQANGVTTGTSETTFSPDNDCTRAQIVTFLYRANQGT